MMLIKFIFQLSLTCLMGCAFGNLKAANSIAQPNLTQSLTVKVKRIKMLEGEIFYQVLKCPAAEGISWESLEQLQIGQIKVTDTPLFFDISVQKDALYIVRLFQDLNQNQTLDFSSNEIPLEPIGISNNPSLMAGKPDPLETCFQYQDEAELVISMRNKKKKRKRRSR